MCFTIEFFAKISVATSNLARLNLFKAPLEKIEQLIIKFDKNKEVFRGVKEFNLNKKIKIKDLSFKYGNLKVFEKLNIELEAKK